jgi:hypothetical protein
VRQSCSPTALKSKALKPEQLKPLNHVAVVINNLTDSSVVGSTVAKQKEQSAVGRAWVLKQAFLDVSPK